MIERSRSPEPLMIGRSRSPEPLRREPTELVSKPEVIKGILKQAPQSAEEENKTDRKRIQFNLAKEAKKEIAMEEVKSKV